MFWHRNPLKHKPRRSLDDPALAQDENSWFSFLRRMFIYDMFFRGDER